jgi:hypothetical protein
MTQVGQPAMPTFVAALVRQIITVSAAVVVRPWGSVQDADRQTIADAIDAQGVDEPQGQHICVMSFRVHRFHLSAGSAGQPDADLAAIEPLVKRRFRIRVLRSKCRPLLEDMALDRWSRIR